MKIKISPGYILAASHEPQAFADWLVSNFGATIRAGATTNTVYIDMPDWPLPVKLCRDPRLPTTEKTGHLTFQVSKQDFFVMEAELKSLGCQPAGGRDHFRYYQVVDAKKQVIGCIHLDYVA